MEIKEKIVNDIVDLVVDIQKELGNNDRLEMSDLVVDIYEEIKDVLNKGNHKIKNEI